MARDPRVSYCLLYPMLTGLITYRYWALLHPEEG